MNKNMAQLNKRVTLLESIEDEIIEILNAVAADDTLDEMTRYEATYQLKEMSRLSRQADAVIEAYDEASYDLRLAEITPVVTNLTKGQKN
jgi:hypothetical protein